MHRGCFPPERCVDETAPEIVPESFRLKRHSALCAAQFAGLVQRDAIVREDDRRAARTRASEARPRRHGEKSSAQQGVHRLEPECGPQNDGGRLFAAGETRPALHLDASKMERAEKGKHRRALFRIGRCAQAIEEVRRSVRAGPETETKTASTICE